MQRNEWTHKIANLVFLTHRINTRASNWDFERKKKEYFGTKEGSSPFVLTQEVLQATEKWTPAHLQKRQERLLKKLAVVWQLHASKSQELSQTIVTDQATDDATLNAKREAIMKAFGNTVGKELLREKGAFYASADGQIRAICTLSKRYPSGAPYWYGYAPQWNAFLDEGKTSFLILGCMDRNVAYAVPHEESKKF